MSNRLPVATSPASPRPAGLAALLACGIAAALLYAATDVVASMSWAEYRAADQGVSELMGLGAPTRPLLVAAFIPFGVLILAFGVGVWRAADGKRGLRVAGVLLIVYAVVGTLGLFSPVHPRGTEFSGTDVRHIIATSALVLLTFLFIGFGSGARGKGFRWYSIATIATLLVCGVISGQAGARLAAHLPTPGFGVLERVLIYSSMLWMVVLAVVMLRPPGTAARP